MHVCTHANIHAYIHTYIHTYMHACQNITHIHPHALTQKTYNSHIYRIYMALSILCHNVYVYIEIPVCLSVYISKIVYVHIHWHTRTHAQLMYLSSEPRSAERRRCDGVCQELRIVMAACRVIKLFWPKSRFFLNSFVKVYHSGTLSVLKCQGLSPSSRAVCMASERTNVNVM